MDRGYTVARKIHPKEKAGPFSFITFAYIFGLVRKGHRRELEEDDLYQVMTKLRSKNLGDEVESIFDEERKKKEPSCIVMIARCFLGRYLLMSLLLLILKIVVVIAVPKSIKKIVSYFKTDSPVTNQEAYIYALVLILATLLKGGCKWHLNMWKTEYSMEIQISLTSLIYRRAMGLSPSKFLEISAGKIVTLITKDIHAFDGAVWMINEFITEVIQTVFIIYMFYQEVGSAAFVGIGVIVLIIPFQILLGKLIYVRRKRSNETTDKRLQLTTEILTAIRVVKMYTWDKFFASKVTEARKQEVKKIRSIFLLRTFSMCFGVVCLKMSFYLLLMFYIWNGNNLSGETVYYIASFYDKLRMTVVFVIPHGIFCWAEMIASVNRIGVVLFAKDTPREENVSPPTINPKITMENASVVISNTTLLSGLNLKITRGLNVVIGPVGSGKSSLIKTILKEHPLISGKIKVEGRTSYASQRPWIFPSSIKQNILFGQTYNAKKYEKVLEVCALNMDLEELANGDDTILSDCGANLSKGQQARVNLARAVYNDSDVYLLDDCLASIDQSVKNYIFQNCIKSFLGDRLCILVTHDSHLISEADNVIILSNGSVLYSGKPADIPEEFLRNVETMDESDVIPPTPDVVEMNGFNENLMGVTDEEKRGLLENTTSKKANIYYEVKKIGKVDLKTYINYLKYGGGLFIFTCIVVLFFGNDGISNYGEKVLSQWVNTEEKTISYEKIKSFVRDLDNTIDNFTLRAENDESSSSELKSIVILAENITGQIINITGGENASQSHQLIADIHSKRNSSDWYEFILYTNQKLQNLTLSNYEKLLEVKEFKKILYLIIIIVVSVLMFVRAAASFSFSLNASKRMHNAMIKNVFGCEMEFFDRNMIGNVINRFSKDLGTIDEHIPYTITATMRSCSMALSGVILIATLNTTFAIFSMGIIFWFLLICKYYIPTSRSLKRLDGSCRSPMIGQLNATLEGLTTVRAFSTQKILADEFDKHQDLSTSAHHTMQVVAQSLGFFLEILSTVYVAFIVGYSLIFHDTTEVGNAGLAITQSMSLCLLVEWALTQWVHLEQNMTSVERALEYTAIQQENKSGQVLENWPSKGSIEYRNVNLVYRKNNEQVLKNINFIIHPQEKIGIVGRTGAGKSSIIVTMFRLYDVDGEILIDNVDVRCLSLDFLRSHIAIIPQDPVLFSGSVRSNVDPTGDYSDEEIWNALGTVNLNRLVSNLDVDIKDSGINFSSGQRQLVCLARAIIRKTKIIILDEATASMDEATDEIIQTRIKELFENYTVITVAHRLNTIMHYDKVMVMEKGEIIEFDSPKKLLENTNGLFYSMVHNYSE